MVAKKRTTLQASNDLVIQVWAELKTTGHVFRLGSFVQYEG